MINDQIERKKALDPQQSFIVQAPAGSGKTELLTQRFLRLLASVKQPESIVALTFTRKAAGEMRARILQALDAAQETAPTLEHAQQTWKLANQVLEQDRQEGWQLLKNPNRLNIQTIDSLCARLARRLPIASLLGSLPKITDNAESLYQEAAKNLLQHLDSTHAWQPAIQRLLLHLDNQFGRCQLLLADLLASRDQWLPYLGFGHHLPRLRTILETALTENTASQLFRLSHYDLPLQKLEALVAFSLEHSQHPITVENPLTFTPDQLEAWQYVIQLLLTETGQWRKQITKRQGFPAESSTKDPEEKQRCKTMKENFKELIANFSIIPGLKEQLILLRLLPKPQYSENQWNIVSALLELLPVLVAELQLIFQEESLIDHSEISLRALRALGDEELPSDLALALDYQLQHLLIDEFQDTSTLQFRLLERLTAGWEPDDGRTLFLVGDPMQSIYRFRKADVGLFLKAQEQGVQQITLNALTLTSNFRSQTGLVEWFNETFSEIFPSQDDPSYGAIHYSQATPILANSCNKNIHVHPHWKSEKNAPQAIIKIIQKSWEEDSEKRIALLVRTRSQLSEIIPLLQSEKIPYQANAIGHLLESSIVNDLQVLLRALLHLGDRLAWLSLLRTPWCGLCLTDLHTIAEENAITLWDSLQKDLPLTQDGKQRLARILPVLENSIKEKTKKPLRQWLEGCWIALGGTAYLSEPESFSEARQFFSHLETHTQNNTISDFQAFYKTLEKTPIETEETDKNCLEIMTVHKSKGLEFDVVILPKLEHRFRHDDPKLLLWDEAITQQGSQLLLAPIRRSDQDHDPIYRYLAQLEKQRNLCESQRLLYVAATRARESLHLVGSVSHTEDGEIIPPKQSPLALLWPLVEADFNALPTPQPEEDDDEEQALTKEFFYRLPSHWQSTQTAQKRFLLKTESSGYQLRSPNTPERHIGTVIHQLFATITSEGLENWDETRLSNCHWIIPQLKSLGVIPSDIDFSSQQVLKAVQQTLNDPKGRWILKNHEDNGIEYALSTEEQGKISHHIIDRCFIDEEGNRWIIDYKTADYRGSQPEEFIAHEVKRYTPQLERYAGLFSLRENRPLRLGLYFPLLPQWVEIE